MGAMANFPSTRPSVNYHPVPCLLFPARMTVCRPLLLRFGPLTIPNLRTAPSTQLGQGGICRSSFTASWSHRHLLFSCGYLNGMSCCHDHERGEEPSVAALSQIGMMPCWQSTA